MSLERAPSDPGSFSALEQELAELHLQLRRMSDLEAIREVLARYVRGIDRHDTDLLRSVFWPDAQVNYGTFSGNTEEFIEWGNKNHERVAIRHEHHITSQSIDLDGATAHVESYVIYFLCEKGDKTTLIGGARYIDRLECRGGEWRILVREFVPEALVRADSVFGGAWAAKWSPPNGGAAWDRTDLSYRRPLSPRT